MTTPNFVFGNFFNTELTAGISVSATTLLVPPSATLNLPILTSGQEARLVLWDGVIAPEIVACTANNQTGTLTVVRAQEGTTAQAWAAGTQVQSTITAEVINAALAAYFDFLVVLNASFLKLTGGTLTGPLILSADPTNPLGAATKQYADSIIGNKLPLAGGTMSGAINMNNNRILSLPAPTSSQEPTTKAYTDAIDTRLSKLFADRSGSMVTAGSATAFTAASNTVFTALVDGIRVVVRFHADSGLAPTFQLDGLAAAALHCPAGTPAPVGMIKANIPVSLTYVASIPAWIVSGVVIPDVDFFPGDVKTSMQIADHGKWLLADGRQVNRVGTHAALFAVAGTKWGIGNGSTTFNILDGRGRCLVGNDMGVGRVTTAGSGIDGNTLGATGGQQNVQLTLAQLANHAHAVTGFNDPGHTHPLTFDMLNFTLSGTAAIVNLQPGTSLTFDINTGSSFTGITFGIGTAGSDAVHTNMQPTSIINLFVRY
jgi:microcystin-dependent protein